MNRVESSPTISSSIRRVGSATSSGSGRATVALTERGTPPRGAGVLGDDRPEPQCRERQVGALPHDERHLAASRQWGRELELVPRHLVVVGGEHELDRPRRTGGQAEATRHDRHGDLARGVDVGHGGVVLGTRRGSDRPPRQSEPHEERRVHPDLLGHLAVQVGERGAPPGSGAGAGRGDEGRVAEAAGWPSASRAATVVRERFRHRTAARRIRRGLRLARGLPFRRFQALPIRRVDARELLGLRLALALDDDDEGALVRRWRKGSATSRASRSTPLGRKVHSRSPRSTNTTTRRGSTSSETTSASDRRAAPGADESGAQEFPTRRRRRPARGIHRTDDADRAARTEDRRGGHHVADLRVRHP